MEQTINAVGLRCPQPIIETKKALDAMDEGAVITIVDNPDAVENLSIFAQNSGYAVDYAEQDEQYHVTIKKEKMTECRLAASGQKLVILISSDVLGQGSDELGESLMKGYIYALTEVQPRPSSLIFMNKGVIFTTEDSPVKESIRALEEEGVEILSCGTCLNYFGLSEKLIAGKVSNMYTIAEKLNQADNAIRI